MSGFIITDFDNPLIGCIWQSEVHEDRLIESLHPLLIEVEDGPFSAEKVLEENIILSHSPGGGCRDWSRHVRWEWWAFLGVVAVE